MKLNLHPKGIPKQEPLGADTPLKKGGVVVGMRKEGDKEKIYFVGDDCHLLCVGATRSGKSRCLVLESICLLGLAGESIFCSDPKAELFHYTADFLKKLGYEVLVLDFKNPEKSMRYNLDKRRMFHHSGRHSLRGVRQPKKAGISEHDQRVLVHLGNVPHHRE